MNAAPISLGSDNLSISTSSTSDSASYSVKLKVTQCVQGPDGDLCSVEYSDTFSINIIDECAITTFDRDVIAFPDVVFSQDLDITLVLPSFTHSTGNKYANQAICG